MQNTSIDKDWWRGAVIYQIYPRSYQDSNGDGIGDLKGITQRLPYVASLGVDAIWISPFFTSPMNDFGYDVSNYCDVDPMFGTLAEFDKLIETAHELGIKVMIDLVLSHTSDQHPWFKESRSSADNDKADWYVWADAKPDGNPPNNWLSIFGGSAWEWDTGRQKYYLHNFLTSQPDLNFHNMDVQQALLDVTRFWLDRGVDGFRLDTINFYVHSQSLKDNPALPPEKRSFNTTTDVNPYAFQSHLYDKSQPENLEFLKKFRAVLDEYPAATAVGEVGDEERGLEIVADYTSGGDKVHMCYGFDFLGSRVPDPKFVHDVFADLFEAAPDSWPCWAFSNHDVVRYASRWPVASHLRGAANRMRIALLLSMRGSVCLYQGEELGLEEADVAFEDLQDPYGIRFWPKFKGRDGCRTPMVWDELKPQAGFTSGTPWLPVADSHKPKSVAQMEARSDSLLHHYRQMLAFRKQHQALIKGDLLFVNTEGNVLTFMRELGDDRVFCAFNLVGEEQEVAFDNLNIAPLDGHDFAAQIEEGKLRLPAFGAFFGALK